MTNQKQDQVQKLNPLIEKFLKSKLYSKLFSMGWQLVHQSVIKEWVTQTRIAWNKQFRQRKFCFFVFDPLS